MLNVRWKCQAKRASCEGQIKRFDSLSSKVISPRCFGHDLLACRESLNLHRHSDSINNACWTPAARRFVNAVNQLESKASSSVKNISQPRRAPIKREQQTFSAIERCENMEISFKAKIPNKFKINQFELIVDSTNVAEHRWHIYWEASNSGVYKLSFATRILRLTLKIKILLVKVIEVLFWWKNIFF